MPVAKIRPLAPPIPNHDKLSAWFSQPYKFDIDWANGFSGGGYYTQSKQSMPTQHSLFTYSLFWLILLRFQPI